jgi:hypothetical protein
LPALVLLVWMYLTRQTEVRIWLRRGLLTALAFPFAMGAMFALSKTLCRQGGLDQQFGSCGIVPDVWANWLLPLPIIGFGAYGAFVVFCAIRLEFRAWRASKR